jgi:hypothetical protein
MIERKCIRNLPMHFWIIIVFIVIEIHIRFTIVVSIVIIIIIIIIITIITIDVIELISIAAMSNYTSEIMMLSIARSIVVGSMTVEAISSVGLILEFSLIKIR